MGEKTNGKPQCDELKPTFSRKFEDYQITYETYTVFRKPQESLKLEDIPDLPGRVPKTNGESSCSLDPVQAPLPLPPTFICSDIRCHSLPTAENSND